MRKELFRRGGAWLLTLALILSLLPTSVLAAGNTIYTDMSVTEAGDGSEAKPFKNFEDAVKAAGNGDTIVIRNKAMLNESSSGVPGIMDKDITIQPEGGSAALFVRTAGIVLGADVTMNGIELNFQNKYHNAIFVNGHRFTAISVTRGSGSREVHLFAGSIGADAHLNFTAAAGTNADITLQGSVFGNIYAGGVAASYSGTMNVDVRNSKALGIFYGSGAQEYKPDENSWFDKTEPDPPVADTKYTAGDATVTVDGSTALTVDGNGAKSMNVIVKNGNNRPLTLSGVTALTAQGGKVKVASINENAHVTLLNSAALDLSGAATGTDVKLATLTSSNGTGKLILGKSHLLTIDSTMKGTFALETPGSFQNASGEAEYDHTYIKAFIANDATVNFTPHSTQSTMQLVKIPGDGTAWTTWKTTAAPTVPTTVSKFETTASSVSTDSNALQQGGITIPVIWESSALDSPFKSLSAIPFHYAVTYNGVTVESVETESEGMYESSVTFTNGPVIWITAGDASEQDNLPDRLDIGGTLTAGVYTITIYAPKADGSKIQLPLTLTVTDGTEAATATELTAPAANAQYTENDSVTLTAKVTSNGQPVTQGEVVFWINGTALGTQGQIKAVPVSADGMASTKVNASAANHFKINETNTVKASYRAVPGAYAASESGEITIRVNEAANVTVTFDAQTNGGELANGSAATQTGKPGMNLLLPSVKDRIGFTFTGWWTEATGGTKVAEPAAIPAANVTYYAQWTEKEVVEVTFDSGDGIWNDNTTGVKHASVKPGFTAAIPGTVSRTGYTFDGWQSDNTTYRDLLTTDEKTPEIQEGQAVHYTPKWKANTYIIHFNANGQADAEGVVADQAYSYDTPNAGLTDLHFASPTKKFLGWSLMNTALTATYQPGDAIDDAMKAAMVDSTDGSITLYAVWTDLDAVSMTFSAGDGAFADGSKEKTESVRPGQQNALPTAPTREGYTFDGWASGSAEYPDLTRDATQTPAAVDGKNASYTAKWIAKTYTIHFDANGQQDAQGTVNDQNYVYDTLNARLTTDVFTSPTHKMLGWGLHANGAANYPSGGHITDALKVAMVRSADGKVTLYAIWAEKDAVTMTFNAGEGAFADNSKEKIESVRPGQQNPLPAAPTRDGYTFNGWASDSVDYPGLSKDATQTPVAIDGKNVTYSAKWVKNPTAQYTVTFRSGSNGSFTNANDSLISQSVESGRSVTGTPDITADRNYSFTGWQIGGAGTVYTRAQVMAMAITKDTVLIASYTHIGGGSSGGGGGGGSTSYTIKASANAGGSISPKGTVSVSRGGDKTFAITASEGYKIADVLVDGKSIGTVSRYTFENVRASHTIKAVFEKDSSGVADPEETGIGGWLNTQNHVAFITGFADGSFAPNRQVTRAQVAQMLYRLLKEQNVPVTVSFQDVPADAWYAKAVNSLASLGIITGKTDGRFDPNAPITRAQFVAIISRFAKVNSEKEVSFTAVSRNDWFYPYLRTAVNYGWINGRADGSFAPNAGITRTETAVIINRMLARSADERFVDASTNLRRYSDVDSGYWAYYAIMEASNSHSHTMTSGEERWNGLTTR